MALTWINPNNETSMVSRRRYPYGDRMLTIDILTLGMGSTIFLSLLLTVHLSLFLEIAVPVAIILSTSLLYLLRSLRFKRIKASFRRSESQVTLSIEDGAAIRQRARQNGLLIVLAIAIPSGMAYVLDPIYWILLLIGSLLPIVLARLGFLVRIRIYEAQINMGLFSYIVQIQDPNGSLKYEHGILFEPRTVILNE